MTTPRPFSALSVEPHAAAALARRGYETATAVQAAVLAPAAAGRDLLVSSATGSGKTVAFGTLIADALLRAPAEGKPRKGRPPRALVVAPTRELAAQVARELEWLLEDGKLRIVAFTGGTDVRGDLRALHGGVDVAVGTPGRLVDLQRRRALDLAQVAVLILDEADEMLDLGFKEDLELLLSSAPATRRTMMFSATIPAEIARLAATHQRDALRVDARAQDTASGHADITYVAHLVRTDDRFAAVVNVLLAAGDAKAIVFARTRDGVSALHQRLVDHGFKAVSMSGDRAQGERDRALEALRSGAARVLVATNVAARGLDLPDVELVLHADLPDSAESLTHRSGRTGRAGRKGRSVVVAEERARRKTERLFAEARVPLTWTPAPTDADVREAQQGRLVADILAEARAAPTEAGDVGIVEVVDRLRAVLPDRVLASLLLAREVARLPAALPVEPVSTEWRRPPDGARRPPKPGAPGAAPAAIFRINLGAAANAEPGWLLPLICRRGGVTRHAVGAIRVGASSSTFEIAGELAGAFARAARAPDPRAPDVRIEPVRGPGGPPKRGRPRK